MSKDVIERAIKKATGELEGVEYEEIRYEGYAPGGVAVIVDCLTDNKVRTVADVRHAFGKFGGNLGTDGSVAFMFQQARACCRSPPARTRNASPKRRSRPAPTTSWSIRKTARSTWSPRPTAFDAVKAAMEAAGLTPDLGRNHHARRQRHRGRRRHRASRSRKLLRLARRPGRRAERLLQRRPRRGRLRVTA